MRRKRCSREAASAPARRALSERIEFVGADVCEQWPWSGEADFVWGEDAWCYVDDKPRLIAEAARITKPGGTIAFTDWVAGPGADDERRRRPLPGVHEVPKRAHPRGVPTLLEDAGCQVAVAEDTGRFPTYVDLYLDMLTKQLTYDALKRIGFDMDMMQTLGGEMTFIQQLAHDHKISQGLVIAHRPG